MKFSEHGSDALRKRNSILLGSRFLGEALQENHVVLRPEHLQVCAQQVKETGNEMGESSRLECYYFANDLAMMKMYSLVFQKMAGKLPFTITLWTSECKNEGSTDCNHSGHI